MAIFTFTIDKRHEDDLRYPMTPQFEHSIHEPRGGTIRTDASRIKTKASKHGSAHGSDHVATSSGYSIRTGY